MAEMAAKQGTEAAKAAYGMDYYVSKQAVDKATNAVRSDLALTVLKEQFENATLKPWQDMVMKLIELQGDREILFIIDEQGNQGKTWLVNGKGKLRRINIPPRKTAKKQPKKLSLRRRRTWRRKNSRTITVT